MRNVRLSSATWIAAVIFCFVLVIFLRSTVHQVTDSAYSMLVSQSLIEHGSFKLDAYALPRLKPKDQDYYISNGPIYQLEVANNRIYYHLPPGTSVLSVPYVALMKLFGIKATNPDGTYNPAGEVKIEGSLAALLMAALAVIFFYAARLRLPLTWSTIVALGATFGTQSWSTASRAMWTDTWGIVLLGIVVLMLLAKETGKRSLNPIWLASLLAWTYFVRPTNAVHIVAITIYLLIYHRRLFIPYALTGAGWFAGFILYSWHNFGQLQPSYYQAKRLNFTVFWTAMVGNLVSPARGLLVYVPVLLFVGYLVTRYWKYIEFQRLVVLSVAIIVGHLTAASAFAHWWGGHSFGPRFTTGLLPWLVLLAILGLEALLMWRRKRHETDQPAAGWRAQLITGGALLLISMFINARGALSHRTWLWNVRPIDIDKRPARLWDWREPQFLAGLVRSPLPREVQLVTGSIDFSTAEADKYLGYGWSDREEHFRWTEGNEAALVFGINQVTDITLQLKLGPFLVPGKRDEQRVFITLNEHQVAVLTLREDAANIYQFTLPKSVLRESNILTFALPDAVAPSSLGVNGDRRLLGIAVYWMQFQPQASPGTK